MKEEQKKKTWRKSDRLTWVKMDHGRNGPTSEWTECMRGSIITSEANLTPCVSYSQWLRNLFDLSTFSIGILSCRHATLWETMSVRRSVSLSFRRGDWSWKHEKLVYLMLQMVLCEFVSVWEGVGLRLGVWCPCPPIRNDIVTPRHLFSFPSEFLFFRFFCFSAFLFFLFFCFFFFRFFPFFFFCF